MSYGRYVLNVNEEGASCAIPGGSTALSITSQKTTVNDLPSLCTSPRTVRELCVAVLPTIMCYVYSCLDSVGKVANPGPRIVSNGPKYAVSASGNFCLLFAHCFVCCCD